jgi:hypothetical protein
MAAAARSMRRQMHAFWYCMVYVADDAACIAAKTCGNKGTADESQRFSRDLELRGPLRERLVFMWNGYKQVGG